jgi:hypothetical protein
MANSDAAFGFRPVRSAGGSYVGSLEMVAFEDENSVATFIGDLVRLEGSADADGNPTVDRFADEDTDAYGVIVAFEPDRTNLELKYRVASTVRQAWVVTCVPQQLFEIQANGAIAATDIGNNADILDSGSGNTTNGLSAMELAIAGIGSGENLLIHRLVPREDNEFGVNAKVLVSVKESAFDTGDGSAGV